MGNCLAPLLAVLYLDFLESTYIYNNETLMRDIQHYYRYIDDIIIVHNPELTADAILNVLNSMDRRQQLTAELNQQESDKKVPFLNVSFNENNSMEYEWY